MSGRGWFRVSLERFWEHVRTLPGVDARYNETNALLWCAHGPHRSTWNAHCHVFATRIIFVYERASNGDAVVLGCTTSPLELELVSSLRWQVPPWDPRWDMPPQPLRVTFYWADPVTLDDVCGAVERVWNRTSSEGDFCNLALQRMLCYVGDAHRPGAGDAFEALRAEQQRNFYERLLLDDGCGERAMLQCVSQHWTGNVLRDMQTDPTHGDYHDYGARHGPHVPRPSLFFRVSHGDGPVTRIAHRDLPAWFLVVLERERVRVAQHHYTRGANPALEEQSRYLFAHFEDTYAAHKRRSRPPSAKGGRGRNGDQEDGRTFDCVDIEDVVARAPPCMRSLLTGGKFPRDGVRNSLARAMIAGGIDLESGERVFNTLDQRERGPSTSVAATRARFSYPYEWEKQYAPDRDCEPLREHCPFPRDYPGEQCVACHAQLRREFPATHTADPAEAWEQMRGWGPYKWWQLTRGMKPV